MERVPSAYRREAFPVGAVSSGSVCLAATLRLPGHREGKEAVAGAVGFGIAVAVEIEIAVGFGIVVAVGIGIAVEIGIAVAVAVGTKDSTDSVDMA